MSILNSLKGDGKLQTEKELAKKRDRLDETVDSIMQSFDEWLTESKTHLIKSHLVLGGIRSKLRGFRIDQKIIDEFCLRLPAYQDREDFEHGGFFITAMLQDAYDNGCDDLELDLSNLEKEICGIGKIIYGTIDRPLRVAVHGDISYDCCMEAQHTEWIINGNAGHLFAIYAKRSHFILNGDIGEMCGESAEDCSFSSPYKEVLLHIRREIGPTCSLYLIDKDGSKEVFR